MDAHFREAGALDQLLPVCWEEGDGWPALARFIGVPVPEEPFPHGNRSTGRTPPPHRVRRNREAAGYWGPI